MDCPLDGIHSSNSIVLHKKPLAEAILHKAQESGFLAAGFATVTPCEKEKKKLLDMLRENRHGEMLYLEKNLPARSHPEHLLPGAKTIFCAALPYHFPLERQTTGGKIARYALCADYHAVVRKKLEALLDFIVRNHKGEINGRVFVDSSPVFEKAWAEKAGIGRIGKNTMLLSPGIGSYLFLGGILLDREIESTAHQLPDPCGDCDMCIKSCPTGALLGGGKLDARKCISYLTVELKREFEPRESAMIGDWLFGCDICQEVCPHNAQKPSPPVCSELAPREELLKITPEQILALTRSQFKTLFGQTPVYRTGLKRLKRNARAVLENREKKVKNQK